MEKLLAADANFLYSETSKCTSNVASVNVLELPLDQSPQEFVATLKTYMAQRLSLVPYLSRKLSYVPGNWDHPVWIQDKNFDIDNHVIEYPVALPGKRAEFENAIAALHSLKMPLDRPLWAMYVLTGLEGGKVAYYNQVHHATIDGASGNAAYAVLMDETPNHPPVTPELLDASADDDQVSMMQLAQDSFMNFMRFQLSAGERARGAWDTSTKLMTRALDPNSDFGAMGKIAPSTSFNQQITDKRTWSTAELPLADVKQLGKTVGATINDVVMAICAGALRSYLERQDKLPEESLIAGCPVSLRKPGDTTPGTQVTMMNVELATQIADPIERLLAIHASAQTAKEVVADLSGVFESNASFPGLPAMISAGIQANEQFGLAGALRGPINVVISNVPGPRQTLYSNGAKMLTHYPVSIPAHGLGLNITVQSYVDQMYFGITACSKALPDSEVFRSDLLNAYRELKNRILGTNVSELRQPALHSTDVKTVESVRVPANDDIADQSAEKNVA
jgi:diacylglycerol O-acyltransferase